MAATNISRKAHNAALKSGQIKSEVQKAYKAYITGQKFTDLQISRRCKIARHEVPDRRKKVDLLLQEKGICIELVGKVKCRVTKVTVGVYQVVKIDIR